MDESRSGKGGGGGGGGGNLAYRRKTSFFERSPPTDILSDTYSDSISGILFDTVPTETWSSRFRSASVRLRLRLRHGSVH